MVNFMKNMALLGGTLALMGVDEPWPASVSGGSEEEEPEDDQQEERRLRLSQRRAQRLHAA